MFDGKMMKSISLFILLYISVTVCYAQDITGRKYFSYADSVFQVGDVKIQAGIYYEADSHQEPRPYSWPYMDSIVVFLQNHPNICIEVGGYSDSRGNLDYNQKLSARHVEGVVSYLIYKGIDKERLSYKGYGESLPLVKEFNADSSDCENCRQQNRRTEIKITCTDVTQPGDYRLLGPSIYQPPPMLIPWEGTPAQYENADSMKKKPK